MPASTDHDANKAGTAAGLVCFGMALLNLAPGNRGLFFAAATAAPLGRGQAAASSVRAGSLAATNDKAVVHVTALRARLRHPERGRRREPMRAYVTALGMAIALLAVWVALLPLAA